MTPGDSVRVTIGGRMHDAEVLYTRGVSVRVRLADGREKTVPVDRVRAEKRSVAQALADAGFVVGAAIPRATTSVREEVDGILARGEPLPVLETPYAPQLTAVPKPRPPWRSSAYMAHVRTFTCCVSGYRAEEAHHHGKHAMSRKGPDWLCIPMAAHEHEHFHKTGTFRNMTREQTDKRAMQEQIDCMTAWCEARGLDYMTAVRDALARVVEGDG